MEVKHHSIEATGFTLILILPVLLFLLFLLFPFYWMSITSVKPDTEIYANPLLYRPQHWAWMTYKKLFGYFSFIKHTKNNLTVAVAIMMVSLVFSTLAVYVFSRFELKGRKFLVEPLLSNDMFPIVLLMIPPYSIMRSTNPLYTPTGLVLAYTTFTIPFLVWLTQGLIRDAPLSLEGAILIDGCNRTGTFVRVFPPILTPCLLAAGVYTFMQRWGEYTLSSMFTDPATRTVPVALNNLIGQLGVEWGVLYVGGAITVLPVCIMFFFAQKKLVSGLTTGVVKGQTLSGSSPHLPERMGNL